jgi:hypothetical protein
MKEMKDMKLILKTFAIVSLTMFLPLTSLYAAPAKPVISRQPAGATYAKNATARFYVNAYSVDGGYLEYQWYRSQPFSAPQSDVNIIKTGATPLLGGVAATLITITPTVTGTQYYYYWVKITNNKNGESDFTESSLSQAKIIDKMLPVELKNGDFEHWYMPGGVKDQTTNPAQPNQTNTFYAQHYGYNSGGQGWLMTGGEYDDTQDSNHTDGNNGWYTTHSPRSESSSSYNLGTTTPLGGLIEIATPYRMYGLPDAGHDSYCAELNADYVSSLYQTIATVPGKIYEWSLDYGTRLTPYGSGDKLRLAVIIGKAIDGSADYGSGVTNRYLSNIYPYGQNTNTYFNDIVSKIANPFIAADGIHTVDYNGSAYYVYLMTIDNTNATQRGVWFHYSGVYTIPEWQGETVFGFAGMLFLSNGNATSNTSGNNLDNIFFAVGTPPALSPTITYDNNVSLSATTKAGYVYGIAEVRGSSVSLVNTSTYYDPDGAGASPEEAISKTAGLGIDGWYSTDGSSNSFVDNGVITFKNLTPGKTYRVVGIPLLAVNTGLQVNESPEYVLDEDYYKDIQMPPAFEGNATTIWNVDVDTYMDGATKRARVIVKSARNDVEYALLRDSVDASGNHIPATSSPAHYRTDWIPGTGGYATFDSLALDAYYYLVSRPYGYAEVTYSDAAYDVDGITPVYIRIKTPGTIEDVDKSNVSRSSNCLSITLANSKTGYVYAVADPETGVIIGSTQNGNDSTLTFSVPNAAKTYQIVTKSGDANWFRGVRVYGCLSDVFSIDYRNELVKSSSDVSGNIPTNVEYNIRSNNAGNTWILGNSDTWTTGIGTQPVDLAAKTLRGNTIGILDSITELNADATLYYRVKVEPNYTGQTVSVPKQLTIPKRPAAPSAPANYVFDYCDEEIDVVSDSLHFAQTNASQWTSLQKNASWTFTNAGWGQGASKKPFNARIPATNTSFASVVRTDTILARPAAPNVGIESNNAISKIVITNMIPGISYQYYTDLDPTWVTYVPVGKTESDSIDFAPNTNCYVRLSAICVTTPASFITVLTSPISIQPVYFANYAYGDTPVSQAVVIINGVSLPVDVTSVELYGANSQYFHFVSEPQSVIDKQVPAHGTNTNWVLIPNSNLDAGTYNTQLKMTYTYNSITYTAYADVYLTVEKANWDMSSITGAFDVSQTKAQKLVLNITDAPAGATLSYYYGSTQATGNPASTVASDGTTSYTFTDANGLQPSTTYPVSVIAQADNNHYASPLTFIATGYTAYATPVFNDVVAIDYINENLTFVSGYNSADYTLGCASCAGTPIISSPYSLSALLEDADNDSIVFSIVHNAGVNPPYPASEAGYSDTILGRPAAPKIDNNTVTHASSATSYDGKIEIPGLFAYRIHGTSVWSSASTSVSSLGVGDYDVRYPATSMSFASRWAIATVSTVVMQPSSVAVVECCIHDTLSVEIPSTVNTVEYQWFVNSTNSNTGGSKVTDATESHFPVPVGLTVGTYYYYCEITIGGVAALVSDAAVVTVTAGLLKGIQSVSPAVVCLGGDIHLDFFGASPYEVYYIVTDGVNTSEYSFVVIASDTTIVANAVGVYTFKSMLDGYVCQCIGNFTAQVTSRVISGVISSDKSIICSKETPPLLTSTVASGGSSGNYSYQWLQSVDNGATWTTISGATSKDYQPNVLEQTTLFKLATSDQQDTGDCDKDTSNVVTITVRPKSLYDYPDLRIRVCPDAGVQINLSKYIDTLDVTSLAWESVSPVIPISNTGTISMNDLNAFIRVYTFAYTVSNSCANDIRRIVYLDPLKNGKMRPLRDSLVICYKYAEALQINQIFGIDADGTWSFEVIAPDASVNIDAYVTESQSSTFSGAMIMNGKAIFENTSARKILVKYKSNDDSCLEGEEYKMKIVLTGN